MKIAILGAGARRGRRLALCGWTEVFRSAVARLLVRGCGRPARPSDVPAGPDHKTGCTTHPPTSIDTDDPTFETAPRRRRRGVLLQFGGRSPDSQFSEFCREFAESLRPLPRIFAFYAARDVQGSPCRLPAVCRTSHCSDDRALRHDPPCDKRIVGAAQHRSLRPKCRSGQCVRK